MRNWRMLFLAALMGLQLFSSHKVQAQEACRFQEPIENFSGPTGSSFGSNTGYETFHTGVDFVDWGPGDLGGQPVYPVLSGKVVWVGNFPSWGTPSWTNSVIVRSDCDGEVFNFLYEHLDPIWKVSIGEQIQQGQPFATVGPCIEFCSEPHLHVGLFNEGIDPMQIERREIPISYSLWRDPEEFLRSGFSQGGLNQAEIHASVPTHVDFSFKTLAPCLFVLAGLLVVLIWIGPMRFAGIGHVGHIISDLINFAIYKIYWGPSRGTIRVWKSAFWLALVMSLPVSCLLSILYGFSVRNNVLPTKITVSLTQGTQFAAIYGRYHGWGTVGTLPDEKVIVARAVENATLVSSWAGHEVRPVVILNIAGAGTSPERPDVITSILSEARDQGVVVALDIQPTPDGIEFAELCETAVSYVASYPGSVWISVDTEYFANNFPAQSINDCADKYDRELAKHDAFGIISIWEFPMNGDWLISEPKDVVRIRPNSQVIPFFDGFGGLEAKVTKMNEMVSEYSGSPFGVAEWQTLYPNQYDFGFEPRRLLNDEPFVLITY